MSVDESLIRIFEYTLQQEERGKSFPQNSLQRMERGTSMLSNWEKQHEKFFREFRDRFHNIYSKMPWGG